MFSLFGVGGRLIIIIQDVTALLEYLYLERIQGPENGFFAS